MMVPYCDDGGSCLVQVVGWFGCAACASMIGFAGRAAGTPTAAPPSGGSPYEASLSTSLTISRG